MNLLLMFLLFQFTPTQFGHHEHNIPVNGWPATTPANAFNSFRIVGDIVGPGGNVRWSNVETADGVYDWTNLDSLIDNYVRVAPHTTVEVVYSILQVPTWAQSDPATNCGAQAAGSCRCRDTSGSGGVNCPAKFSAFVTALTARYDGKIKYYELWNEPNNSSGQVFWWGLLAGQSEPTAVAELAGLAAIAYPIVHGHSNTSLLSPVPQGNSANTWMGSYLTQAASVCAGVGNNHCLDLIGFHGYVGTNPELEGTLVNNMLAAMSSAGLSGLQLWDTEHSWGLDSAVPDSDMESSWVARHEALFYSRAGTGARSFWYAWSDAAIGTLWNKNTHVILPPGTAWNQMASWLTDSVFTNTCALSGLTIYTCTLTRGNATPGQIMWDNSQTCSGGNCTTSNQTVPSNFNFYLDLAGIVTPISCHIVPVGVKPVFLIQ